MNQLLEPPILTRESAPQTETVEIRPVLEIHKQDEMYCVREEKNDFGSANRMLELETEVEELENLSTFQPVSIGVCAMNKKVSAYVLEFTSYFIGMTSN